MIFSQNIYAFLNSNNVFCHVARLVSLSYKNLDHFILSLLISNHQLLTYFYVYFQPMSLHKEKKITKDILIYLYLPVTNTPVSRKAKPNAKSLSHKYMVISGNRPYSYETACVLLKGKIIVISAKGFLCETESKIKEMNAYSLLLSYQTGSNFLLCYPKNKPLC